MILHDDLRVVPDSWTQLKGQPVGQHPREGIPKHGRPDQRPEGGGDYFRSRGVGMDHTPGCFVCGGAPGFYSNIAAFVQCRAAGERVVAMFTQGARLDYREFEPDRIQVKIGACEEHLPNLRVLDQLAGVITTEALALAMRPLPA